MARYDNSDKSIWSSRNVIAFATLFVSFVGITLLAIFAIDFSGSGNRGETTKLIFNAVLPLFGTWVGTVLAFYFARDNFDAATQSTALLTGIQTTPTTVDKIMIRREQILALEVDESTSLDEIALSDLYAMLEKTSWERLPIFGVDKAKKTSVVKGIVTKRVLTTYAAGQSGIVPAVFEKKTVKDLSQDCRKQLDLWDTVAPKASVADARTKMTGPPLLADLFVTEGGAKDGNALGWLTNSLLAGTYA